jgi:hypothetical protein
MTIVLQQNEEVFYNPITGELLKESDTRTHILYDGRICIDLGNCNQLIIKQD